MKVSVIIPIYNVQPYLRRCVESVLLQTWREVEIILVDDGSTDGSASVCDNMASEDDRIKVIHKVNGGLSDARNAGLRSATGDHVAFLDADDVWLQKDGLEQMVSKLESNPADLLLFKRVDYYPNRQSHEKNFDVDYIGSHSAGEVFTRLVLSQRFNMSACFQLIRRRFLTDNNLWFPIGMLSEDVDWSLRLWQCATSVQAMNIEMYGYHHREGSITTTYTIRNLRCYDKMFSNWKDKIAKHNCVNSETIVAYLANLYVSCLYAYRQISVKDRQEAREILHRHVDLLDYAMTPKSLRARKIKRIAGEQGMIMILSLYGLLKRELKK